MASTALGDIPGARFHAPAVAAHASVASGGANGLLGQIGPFDHNIRPRSVWWTPTGADQAATKTDSYRQLSLRNGGTSGTGTAIMGSVNLTASQASRGTVGFNMDTTATLAAGQVMYFSQATVGGADANGTVLVAGQFALSFEVI